MKVTRINVTATVFLFFGTMISVQAQRDGDKQGDRQRDKSDRPQAKQNKNAPPQPKGAPQARQQQTQRPQASRPSQPQRTQPARTRQQAQSWQQQKGWLRQGAWQGRSTWQQNRAQHWASDHRSWAQRGGYGGYYVPQASFGLYFGSQNFFRLGARPVIYMGYPRFQYQGYSFLMLDPWPEDWSESWYASDDVYIDYDDGYYLYNRRYPQERLTITLAL